MPERRPSVKRRDNRPCLAGKNKANNGGMIRRFLKVAVIALVVIVLIPLVLVPLYSVRPPVTTLMLWRWAKGEPVVRYWRSLEMISPALVRAVVVAEDGRFCSHAGVDWIEFNDALDDAEDLSDMRGTSTIAMQTAKNLFLWPGRQVVRKAIEVPLAYYIGAVWPKRRLIEVYLNIVEWGPKGEFGAEAAAARAFRKSAGDLSLEEAALLAATLPNPKVRNAAMPGPGLRRLAARVKVRAEAAGATAVACVGRPR
jgi:monofunctional glycosyltransferase